jgi:hypothetical protein
VAPRSSFWMPCTLRPARSASPSCVSPAASRCSRSRSPNLADESGTIGTSPGVVSVPGRLAASSQAGGQAGELWVSCLGRLAGLWSHPQKGVCTLWNRSTVTTGPRFHDPELYQTVREKRALLLDGASIRPSQYPAAVQACPSPCSSLAGGEPDIATGVPELASVHVRGHEPGAL